MQKHKHIEYNRDTTLSIPRKVFMNERTAQRYNYPLSSVFLVDTPDD